MLTHYLLIAFRNFRRFKATFLINLIGLSTGIACSLLIYLWINDELSIDKFHEKDDRLFQVMENSSTDNGISTQRGSTYFVGESLKADFPEVEYAVVTTPPDFFPSFSLTFNNNHVKGSGKFASREFFNVFSYALAEGNKNEVLKDKNSIVISTRLAERLFGKDADIIGRSFEYKLFDMNRQVTVTGIFNDVPGNSSDQFDFILPFNAFREIMKMNGDNLDWDNSGPFYTYVSLVKDTDRNEFNGKVADYLKRNGKNSSHRTLFVQPYSENYLHGTYENGVQSGGRIVYIQLFSLIAFFILLIACINFMNLSTARATLRIKEIAVKKTIGAGRQTLILQYLSESVLIASLSCIIAVLIADLFLPEFNRITGKHIELTPDPKMLTMIAAATLITGLFAGSYPALYLSRFNPISILRGRSGTTSFGEVWARKGLAIVQFTISIIFIVSVIVIYKQIEFIQNKNLGYNKKNLMYFEAEGNSIQNAGTFLSELEKLPGVVSASSMLGNVVGESGGIPASFNWKGKNIVMNSAAVNYGLIETLGLEIKEGRSFSRAADSDTAKVICNEAAIEAMGITDPIGTKMPGGSEIIGVVKDFHFRSLHEKIQPFCFRLEPHYAVTFLIRIYPGSTAKMIESLQAFYKKFNPGYSLDYEFLDREYQTLYVAEQRVSSLSKYFAGLAIVISCLGLLGQATFNAERRQKEIGIRKVLGSSDYGIIRLLSGDFNRMIGVSIVIAIPVSYWLAMNWLDNFAYHIELRWWYFAFAGMTALIIAWLIVGVQTVRAAKINPVECLKNE